MLVGYHMLIVRGFVAGMFCRVGGVMGYCILFGIDNGECRAGGYQYVDGFFRFGGVERIDRCCMLEGVLEGG